MKYDFDNDLKQEILTTLSRYGIKISDKGNLNNILLDYLTLRSKYLSADKREVHISPVLQAKLSKHPKRTEIATIASAFKAGKNVNSFQSTSLKESKAHDHMMYEWGIYHFHLSTKQDKKTGFVTRTNEVLFTFVDDRQAIFLDTAKHSSDSIFADVRWLEILYDHFPQAIEQYYVPNFQLAEEVDAEGRLSLWKKGLSLGGVMVRGKYYRSICVARTTSRHSVLTVKQSNEILRWLHYLNDTFGSRYDEICALFGLEPKKTAFKLRFGPVTLEVVEHHSSKLIVTYRNLIPLP